MMPEETQPPVLRRIGLIGDVHGESAALAAVLAFLQNLPDLDALLCTSDVPGKQGVSDSDACARLLTEAGVQTIRGNHDRWALIEEETLVSYSGTEIFRCFAESLPRYLTFETPLGSALLCHGVADNDMDGIYPGGDDETLIYLLKGRRIYGHDRVMICGHTHEHMVRQLGTLLIVNAGTLRRDNEPCFSVVDFDTGQVPFYNVDPDALLITTADTFRFPVT